MIPQKPKMGFKFSRDIYISKLKLDDMNVSYKEEDLEDTPWGRVYRMKHEEDNGSGQIDS